MEGPGKDVHADDLEYRNVDVHIQIHNRTQVRRRRRRRMKKKSWEKGEKNSKELGLKS